MATTEQRNHARTFLKKAQEYLASAEDSLAAERHTPAAGDAIHAGISSKDAILTTLTGSTGKGKDHVEAVVSHVNDLKNIERNQKLTLRGEIESYQKKGLEIIVSKVLSTDAAVASAASTSSAASRD